MAQSMPFVDDDDDITISPVNPVKPLTLGWKVFKASTKVDWEVLTDPRNWDMKFYDLVVIGQAVDEDPRLVFVTSKRVSATGALSGFTVDDLNLDDWQISSPQVDPRPPTALSLVKELKGWSRSCRFRKFGNVESTMTKMDWHKYYSLLEEDISFGVPVFAREQYVKDMFDL